jgi:hypothetical protein
VAAIPEIPPKIKGLSLSNIVLLEVSISRKYQFFKMFPKLSKKIY